MEQKIKESFFTKDPTFYRTLFPLLITVALQNIVAYSVNMADNIMLGSYSQNALSGAATVNQIFFMVQQITLGIGEGFVVLGAQYWGQGRMQPIRKLTGIALKLGLICGIITILICTFIPHLVISIFTNDPEIIARRRCLSGNHQVYVPVVYYYKCVDGSIALCGDRKDFFLYLHRIPDR